MEDHPLVKSGSENAISTEKIADIANAYSLGLGLNEQKIRKQRPINTDIPPSYTFGKGADGSAWVFVYAQTLGNKEYILDKMFYNVVGQAACTQHAITYLGSDSGVFQNKKNFDMFLNSFDPVVKKNLLKQLYFDCTFHQLGEPELLKKKGKILKRSGFNVGNGQGLCLTGFLIPHPKMATKNTLTPGKAGAAAPSTEPPIEKKYLVAPLRIIYAPPPAPVKSPPVVPAAPPLITTTEAPNPVDPGVPEALPTPAPLPTPVDPGVPEAIPTPAPLPTPTA